MSNDYRRRVEALEQQLVRLDDVTATGLGVLDTRIQALERNGPTKPPECPSPTSGTPDSLERRVTYVEALEALVRDLAEAELTWQMADMHALVTRARELQP